MRSGQKFDCQGDGDQRKEWEVGVEQSGHAAALELARREQTSNTCCKRSDETKQRASSSRSCHRIACCSSSTLHGCGNCCWGCERRTRTVTKTGCAASLGMAIWKEPSFLGTLHRLAQSMSRTSESRCDEDSQLWTNPISMLWKKIRRAHRLNTFSVIRRQSRQPKHSKVPQNHV